jgi:lysophospholipase L1-like esterase
MTQPIDHLTVVFFGDSITEGQYVHHSLRWAEMTTNRLRAEFASRLDPARMFFYVNGISGETTRQALERYPRQVQQLAPDVLTIQFGLNDCNCWDSDRGVPRVSEAAYRANLVEMIERARRFGTRQIVLSTNHPTLRHRPLISGETLEQRRAKYNDIVREVARETSVTLCDVAEAFAFASQEQLADLLLPEPDVLHLSPAGHQIYSDAITPALIRAVNLVLDESR